MREAGREATTESEKVKHIDIAEAVARAAQAVAHRFELWLRQLRLWLPRAA